MVWDPIRADHSIEKATLSVVLLDALDGEKFDELVAVARDVAKVNHLTSRAETYDPIEAQGGVITLDTSSPPPRRIAYQRKDVGGVVVDEFSIGMKRIAVGTQRYRRWKDFIEFTLSCFNPLNRVVDLNGAIRSVRLEYVDKFRSERGADVFQVINKESEFLTKALLDKTDSFHLHAGWFDLENENVRRLTNLNIDVADVTHKETKEQKRQISMLSLAQVEALRGSLDRPFERMNELHAYLKKAFGDIITREAAERIALNK